MTKTKAGPGIRVTYDAEADVLAIDLRRPRESIGAKEVSPGHYLHQDAKGRFVSLEVLDASEHYGRAGLEQLPSPTTWLTVGEAAEKSGLAPTTLRTQIHAGKLRAERRARDWVVAEHELWNYLERRAPQGRRSTKERRRARRPTLGQAPGKSRRIAARKA